MDLSAFTHERMERSPSLREDCKKLRALVLRRLHAARDPLAEADAIAAELIALGHRLFDWNVSAHSRWWTPDYMAVNTRRHRGISLKIDPTDDGPFHVEVAFETRRLTSQRVS